MFAEDLGGFFADFAVAASWTPANGSPAQTAQVMLDEPDMDIFGASELSRDWMMSYPSSQLVGLKTGEIVTVNGADYKVREIKALEDGTIMSAKLSKF